MENILNLKMQKLHIEICGLQLKQHLEVNV